MKRIVKWLSLAIIALLLAPIFIVATLYWSADMGEPKSQVIISDYTTQMVGDTLYCGKSYLRSDASELWELYLVGSGQDRGATQGVLTKDLMKYQEDVFIDQIREIIPSDRYLSFLRVLTIVFNRNLGKYIPLEYRSEIAAIAQSCTDEYNAIGTPYERQLNYHAAHDIGHTMQQYMLVGCSSFGVWGTESADEELLIGRNFDFYVGDDFAKNKIITFASPENGYRHASIGWAGMVGVLSGMNEKGLTVTLNAAKGAMPTSAAVPISILAREILQYASNIEEAYHIAESNQTFVSESLMIGSTEDGETAIIEKTPQKIALYRVKDSRVVCTNHYQSAEFAEDSYNIENIEQSDSKYRFDRLTELLDSAGKVDYVEAIDILRNRYGHSGEDIGVGNEMTLNQSIAHHAVVFKPGESKMWVSTKPWQSGEFVCYDLKAFFFEGSHPKRSIDFDVTADSVFIKDDYACLMKYRRGIKRINEAISLESRDGVDDKFISEFIAFNPLHYYTYRLVGDFYVIFGNISDAKEMYRKALECEMPYKSERIEIEKLIYELI